jgi:hypothetical protein
MALTITQQPLYPAIAPVGQQLIFTVIDPTVVATEYKVKYVAEIHVSTQPIMLSPSASSYIGTFKTTPNNAGAGIFDIRNVLETFLKPDNEGSKYSTYKIGTINRAAPPIHLIDFFSLSENSIKYYAINFYTESALNPTDTDIVRSDAVPSQEFTIFNGVIQYDDVLSLISGDFGYSLLQQNFFLTNTGGSFLSTAPTTQYARLTDYGTLPFLNYLPSSIYKVQWFTFTYYWAGGSSTETFQQNTAGGGSTNYTGGSKEKIMYIGAFPANLRSTSTLFQTAITNGLTHYEIFTETDNVGGNSSATYTIQILCPNERGYEGIRLTWLNQWGTWDYYTFNMKSTKSIATKRTSYTQLGGTWNKSQFKIAGYKGGKKNFRVNSIEKIKMNTDFVTEAEGIWFEQLINSNEVYVLDGFQTDPVNNTALNNYVTPATLTTSSYITKTIANDRLMQYTFEIEKSKTKRTQAV